MAHLTTEELIELHKKQEADRHTDELIELHKKKSEKKPEHFQYAPGEYPKNAIEYGLAGAGHVLNFADKYIGSPIRATIGTLQNKNKGLLDAVQAAKAQFGEDASKAPSGKDLAANMGFSTKPYEAKIPEWFQKTVLHHQKFYAPEDRNTKISVSPAELAGLPLSVATDPVGLLAFVKGPKAAGAALTGAGKAYEGGVHQLSKIAEERALKVATGQGLAAERRIARSTAQSPGHLKDALENLNRAGRDILEEPGLLKSYDRVESLAPKLGDTYRKYGEKIGEVGLEIDKLMPQAVSAQNIANEILKYASTIPETPRGIKLQERLMEEALVYEKKKHMSFKEAQAFKNDYQWKAADADNLISNKDATNKINQIIGREMEMTVERLSGYAPSPAVQETLEKYKEFKSKYGSFKQTAEAATNRVLANRKNRWGSPSDYAIGIATGLGSSPATGMYSLPTAVATAFMHKLVRERGSAFVAKTADKAAKALDLKKAMQRRTEKKP